MDIGYDLNRGYQPTIKRNVDMGGADFYPTPSWATKALIDYESFEGDIWEPACGDGAMAEVLKLTGQRVVGSDLYDRGYGEIGHDFLTTTRTSTNIITNPPYNSAEGFVQKALSQSDGKVALLLRLAFLESAKRKKNIFTETPPSRIWVFSERITFYPKNAEIKGSGTTAYAWFVWEHPLNKQTQLGWIEPGYKKNYASL